MAGTTAAAKTPAKAKAPRKAAQAALAELEDAPRIGMFRGLAITLPSKLPATFALDMAEMQAGEGGADLSAMYRMVVGVIGTQQWHAVRDKVAADGQSMDDIGEILTEMLAAITDPYDVEPGESPASGNS